MSFSIRARIAAAMLPAAGIALLCVALHVPAHPVAASTSTPAAAAATATATSTTGSNGIGWD